MEMLKEENGRYSSKRIWGSIYMSAGLLFVVLDQLFGKEIDFDILLLVIGTGAGLIGINVLQYFRKK